MPQSFIRNTPLNSTWILIAWQVKEAHVKCLGMEWVRRDNKEHSVKPYSNPCQIS